MKKTNSKALALLLAAAMLLTLAACGSAAAPAEATVSSGEAALSESAVSAGEAAVTEEADAETGATEEADAETGATETVEEGSAAEAVEEEAVESADNAVEAEIVESAIDTIMTAGTAQSFSDEPVPEEDIQTILLAGLAAESAINMQPWFFAAVTNKDVMAELSGGGFPGGAANASLGDSPLAIIVYMDQATASPNPNFDCGLAVQNMYLAAASLGYGVKIVSSPTMTLNGGNHDQICETLGVDPALTAVAVLLIGKPDETVDATTGASDRSGLNDKTSIIE